MVDAERGQPAGVLALDHHVGADHQPAEPLLAPGIVQVDGDPQLGGVVVPPPQAPLGAGLVGEERAVAALGRSARRLDHDHLGTHVGAQLGCPGASLVAQLDDPQPFEWPSAPMFSGHQILSLGVAPPDPIGIGLAGARAALPC